MQRATVNGVELEYEITGEGEPVLLISMGPITDCFLPFASQRVLTDKYRLIMYHQRGQAGSTHSAWPVTFAQHAADAGELLNFLGVRSAHVVGHSTGAAIGLQLALERPAVAHSLVLLEPPLPALPSAETFFDKAGPAVAAYELGNCGEATARFLSAASSLDWTTCRAVLDKHIPGGVEQAMEDADTFFSSYLPALNLWRFGDSEAASISQPVLSVLGTDTEQGFADGHELLHSWFPQIEDCVIEDVGHLLQLQRPTPVAEGIAEFLARHPITGPKQIKAEHDVRKQLDRSAAPAGR